MTSSNAEYSVLPSVIFSLGFKLSKRSITHICVSMALLLSGMVKMMKFSSNARLKSDCGLKVFPTDFVKDP